MSMSLDEYKTLASVLTRKTRKGVQFVLLGTVIRFAGDTDVECPGSARHDVHVVELLLAHG
jgi:hypothetical protein